jgi:glycine reductase complex component B subunit gamma
MPPLRIVLYVNQFFGGLGGEDKAGASPQVKPGPQGPGVLLQQLLGTEAQIVATVLCGDNRMAERQEETLPEVVELVRGHSPDMVVAGPAFGAGRYGVACAAVCTAVHRVLGVPVLTGMFPENPGAEGIDPMVIVAVAGESAQTMKQDLERLSRLVLKVVRREPIGPADEDGYLPRGKRINQFGNQTGAERMLEMLVQKLHGEPFVSEVIVPQFERVPAAPPVHALNEATLAIITTSGVVPQGNPEGVESWRATKWVKNQLSGLSCLSPEEYTCVHGGYDNRHIRANPNRTVPLDVLRQYEKEGRIGKLHNILYSTVGNVMPVARARQFGREIARELLEAQVQAAILTAT